MLTRRRVLAQTLALASAITAGRATSVFAGAKSGAHPSQVVTIEGMHFNPPQLTVKRGERVVWVNKDLFPHTATADGKAFDSHEIASNASWGYVPRTAGTYAYGCTLHPTMKGTLTVI